MKVIAGDDVKAAVNVNGSQSAPNVLDHLVIYFDN